ncbi:MAG: mechanosensitive ion channel [Bacteroidia bacterium]|nr:mechanosensitive ion channel [Bacteroidia bacterium]
MVVDYAPKVVLAILLLIAGFWIIKRISRGLKSTLNTRGFDPTLGTFLSDMMGVILKAVLLISVIEILGVKTTSFVAILGAAGLAVGFALQGSLANFAGGVMLMLFRPFKVGDLVDIDGKIGNVTAINIFVTTLLSPDHKTVILPNGPVAGGTIINLTAQGSLRVDLVMGISYGDDIQKARAVLMEVMKNHPNVLQDPAPSVNVSELGESSVKLAVRPYATVDDYWTVYFGIYEQGKEALDAAGITIPLPQRVVHQAK